MLLVAEASNGREAYRVSVSTGRHYADGSKAAGHWRIDAMVAIRTEFADARIIMLTTFEGMSRSVAHFRQELQATCSRPCPAAFRDDPQRCTQERAIPPEIAAHL